MSPALSPPRHHPSAATLMDYASGAGSSEHARVIAAHVAACPECRAQVALAEGVGGALLDALEPEPMSDGALDRALAALDLPAPTPQPLTAAVRRDWISAPDEVLEAALKRRRWAAPGVWVAPISDDRASGRRSYLLRVAAGMAVPHHGHRGAELTVVLKGAFDDGKARFSAGDFAEVGEEVEHHPHVTADSECICLIAADAPLIPLDWVGRVFQPFVRI
jgi:putative transcriptional regulator